MSSPSLLIINQKSSQKWKKTIRKINWSRMHVLYVTILTNHIHKYRYMYLVVDVTTYISILISLGGPGGNEGFNFFVMNINRRIFL